MVCFCDLQNFSMHGKKVGGMIVQFTVHQERATPLRLSQFQI